MQNIFEIGKPVHPVKNAGHNDEENFAEVMLFISLGAGVFDEEKRFKAVPEATDVVDFMRGSGQSASTR